MDGWMELKHLKDPTAHYGFDYQQRSYNTDESAEHTASLWENSNSLFHIQYFIFKAVSSPSGGFVLGYIHILIQRNSP